MDINLSLPALLFSFHQKNLLFLSIKIKNASYGNCIRIIMNKPDDKLKHIKTLLTEGQAYKDEKPDTDDIRIAHDVHTLLQADHSALSLHEKNKLKDQLRQSVRKYRKRKILYIGSAAAAAVLIIAFFFTATYWYKSPSSSLETYAQSIEYTENTGGNTRLFLADKQSITIETVEATIEYTKNGSDIKVNTTQEIRQQTENDSLLYNTVIVPYGRRAKIILNDSSRVWLNAGSKLVYPAVFEKEKREVFLEGEAIFDVEHDEKRLFHVLTNNIRIKVLGTLFNVSAYPNDPFSSAALERGSIELNYKGHILSGRSEMRMTPGSLAVYYPAKRKLLTSKVDTKNYLCWREGFFIFEKEPLINILKKLERYYNVKIQLQDAELGTDTFSGYLDLKDSPTDVLDVIRAITAFSYTRSGDQITIKPLTH